eukprot:1130297-Rhodomonas_salina.1
MLRPCYAKPGADLAYGPTSFVFSSYPGEWEKRRGGQVCAYAPIRHVRRMVVCACAMFGTGIAYGGMRLRPDTPSPVLTS